MGSSVANLDVCGCDRQICAFRNRNRTAVSTQKFDFSVNGMDLSFSSIGVSCSDCDCARRYEWTGILGAG